MKQYTHLTEKDRYTIELLRKQGKKLAEIARCLNRHPSTISREITRNTGKRGYRHAQAGRLTQERHQRKVKAVKMDSEMKSVILSYLQQDWSPEQISGRLALENRKTVSHETIYRWLLRDQKSGGQLYLFLRHKCKKYRKRYGKQDYRGIIPNRVDIEERPEIVDTRTRLGDWEADTVIGQGHQGALITLTERVSRFSLALPILNKTAVNTTEATIKLLGKIKKWVHTITYDNGREFSHHQKVAQKLECDTFFAKPYHSWERGLNENTNGLLRQYFPKKSSLKEVSIQQVQQTTEKLNNRPRKCLNYRTPYEVFRQLSGDSNFLQPNVALMM